MAIVDWPLIGVDRLQRCSARMTYKVVLKFVATYHSSVFEWCQHQLVANQQSPKSGDFLHKTCNGSTPDPYFSPPPYQKKNKRSGHARLESDNEQSDLKAENAIHCVTQTINKPLIVQLEINGIQLPFEVDTGAAVSLISLETKRKFLKDVQIQETTVSLHTYTSQSIQVVGTMQVQVRYGDHVGEHKLFVVKGVGSTLIGRDWLQDI